MKCAPHAHLASLKKSLAVRIGSSGCHLIRSLKLSSSAFDEKWREAGRSWNPGLDSVSSRVPDISHYLLIIPKGILKNRIFFNTFEHNSAILSIFWHTNSNKLKSIFQNNIEIFNKNLDPMRLKVYINTVFKN